MYKSLDELIGKLELIRDEGAGTLNFPKALYLLSKEIQEIKSLCQADEQNERK